VSVAAFSLQEGGAKKKLAKRNAGKGFARARATQGAALGNRDLLKKVDQNLHTRGRCAMFALIITSFKSFWKGL
jgi:hypothetical protein